MALDGTDGDIFPREGQKLNAGKRSRGRAPLCVWILGQNQLSCSHAWRVLFLIQQQHSRRGFGLAGACCPSRLSVHVITRESLQTCGCTCLEIQPIFLRYFRS